MLTAPKVHLLIREREDKIGMSIKRIASSYVYYYNHKYSRDGHLFRERFKSEPVNDMSYFVTLLRYIHQNPLKAGIVDEVQDYEFSSWGEYTDPNSVLFPLYLLFRKSPNIPDMRFSELLVSLVYTYNMMLVYQIVIGFFRLPSNLYFCILLLPIIPMKQLSGFPWWRSILNVLLAYLATYYMLIWGIDGIATLYAKIMLL